MHARPPGGRKTLKSAVLGKGADLLQDVTPVKQFDVHVVGFHCGKSDPSMQMEAHHYCRQVNEDFLQCVVFDGDGADAALIGVEYIISERLFEEELPEEEKRYWHPHNYEVLSGQLVAPGLPDVAEKELMKLLINSYGKTWHFWHTAAYGGGSGDRLPLGDPALMWSFNRDGEMKPEVERYMSGRMRELGIDTGEKRRERQDLVGLARPQRGVDALRDAFPGAGEPPPGVREAGR